MSWEGIGERARMRASGREREGDRERNCLPCSLSDCALAGVQFTCARLPKAAASEE